MRGPLRPLCDPLPQQVDLAAGQPPLTRIGRRHLHVGVVALHAFQQRASLWFSRRNGLQSAAVGNCARQFVEPQIGLSLLGIGTVAMETVFGKDRPNLAAEVDRFVGIRRRWHKQANAD